MKSILISITVLLLTIPSAWPQASTGRVSGTVYDKSGAVIPAAQVSITNSGTNVSSTTRTTESGRYVVPGVTPGPYRLVVESAGMKKYEVDFDVQVQQSVVIDPVLEVGSTATEVEVTSVVPMTTVDSAVVSQTLERARVEQLPINGRGLKTLLAVIPELDDMRALGAPEGATEFVLDGSATVTQRWSNHSTLAGMLDTIQELRLDSNATSSKYSRPTTLVMSTRSGSNRFHGSAFETNRNSGFGVARQRQDTFSKPPHMVRNEFGLSAGGPVYIPQVYNGKNRTFWFAGYEANRQYWANTVGWQVPTMAMRQGDFSQMVQSDGRQPVLYDPWSTNATTFTRQPFSDGGVLNRIPAQRMSPLAKYLFGITPQPTTAANPLVENNWWGTAPAGDLIWSISTRVDHHLSDKDQIFGRYSQSTHTELGVSGGQIMLNNVNGTMYTIYPSKTLAFNYVRTFTPTLINELLVSGYKNYYWNGPGGERKDWAGQLGLPNPSTWTVFPRSGPPAWVTTPSPPTWCRGTRQRS